MDKENVVYTYNEMLFGLKNNEIPPYAIAGGNPAKVFKYRNIEHFQKLKAEGKFY